MTSPPFVPLSIKWRGGNRGEVASELAINRMVHGLSLMNKSSSLSLYERVIKGEGD